MQVKKHSLEFSLIKRKRKKKREKKKKLKIKISFLVEHCEK
jgi:hypothetical protein